MSTFPYNAGQHYRQGAVPYPFNNSVEKKYNVVWGLAKNLPEGAKDTGAQSRQFDDSNDADFFASSVDGSVYNANDNGFLWKPISEHGNLVILLPSETRGNVSGVNITTNSGQTVSGTFSGDTHNGMRPHFRFDDPGASYGNGVVVTATVNGKEEQWFIENGGSRNGSGGGAAGLGGLGSLLELGGLEIPGIFTGEFDLGVFPETSFIYDAVLAFVESKIDPELFSAFDTIVGATIKELILERLNFEEVVSLLGPNYIFFELLVAETVQGGLKHFLVGEGEEPEEVTEITAPTSCVLNFYEESNPGVFVSRLSVDTPYRIEAQIIGGSYDLESYQYEWTMDEGSGAFVDSEVSTEVKSMFVDMEEVPYLEIITEGTFTETGSKTILFKAEFPELTMISTQNVKDVTVI